MEWQQPAALAVVVLTAFLFVRREIRARRRAHLPACGHDCSCGVLPAGQKRDAHTERIERHREACSAKR